MTTFVRQLLHLVSDWNLIKLIETPLSRWRTGEVGGNKFLLKQMNLRPKEGRRELFN